MADKVTTTRAGYNRQIGYNEKLIRYDGTNEDLLWRIWGDTLNPEAEIVVPLTHDVIIVKDGSRINTYNGGSHRLFNITSNGLFGLGRKTDAKTVDVIFVNKTLKMQIRWGTQTPVKMRDPLTGIPVDIRAYGVMDVNIDDSEKFYLEFVGQDASFSVDKLRQRLFDRLMGNFNNMLSRILREQKLSYADLQLSQEQVNEEFAKQINEMFLRDYGIRVCSFTVGSISLSEEEQNKVEREINRIKDEMRTQKTAAEIVAEMERLEDRANARADEKEENAWKRALTLRLLDSADHEKFLEVQKILAQREETTTVVINDDSVAATTDISGKRKCHMCGEEVGLGAKFCRSCGAKLAVVCPNCGAELVGSGKFCPECGSKLD